MSEIPTYPVIQSAVKHLVGLTVCPEILQAGHPMLRSPTKTIGHNAGAEIGRQLAEKLLRYRGATGYGRGLAAPQVGIPHQVFVAIFDGGPEIFINPKVVRFGGGKCLYRESCLSCGPISADVKRPARVLLQAVRPGGHTTKMWYEGIEARIVLHELDHLKGRLCVDEAEPHSIFVRAGSDPLTERIRPC